MNQTDRTAAAGLGALIVLQSIMLMSLFAGVEPHPPAQVAPFGMAPFLAASISAALAALVMRPLTETAGRILTSIAILLALVSFGPHKIIDPTFPQIYPAVLTAWIAIVSLVTALVATRRSTSAAHTCG